MSQTKHVEEREFYMLAAIRQRWTKRELERQIGSGAALRAAPRGKKVSPVVTQIHPLALPEDRLVLLLFSSSVSWNN